MKRGALLWGLVFGVSAWADSGAELAHINAALKTWLQALEADAPYLLLDRGAAELCLMHGKAVMRSMAVVADSLGVRPPVRAVVEGRLRRFRPSTPWSHVSASPFDWEQNLVVDASAESALYFTGNILVHASPVWHRPGAVALQLAVRDLRALYRACKPGIALIVLPSGWREGRRL